VMGLLEYQMFAKDCEIADPNTADCRKADLDRIFIASDLEERGSRLTAEQKATNDGNIDRALMRFEWLHALVRIAIAKCAAHPRAHARPRRRTAGHHNNRPPRPPRRRLPASTPRLLCLVSRVCSGMCAAARSSRTSRMPSSGCSRST
jgi:hypothetical protein